MSNQTIDLEYLSILAQYVNGEKTLNYDEIENYTQFAKRLKKRESNTFSSISNTAETKLSPTVSSLNQSEILPSNAEEDSEVDSEVDVSEYIPQDTSDSKFIASPVKTRRKRNVWSDKFINEFKPEVLEFIQKKGSVRQETLFNFFELHFKHRLNSEDLEKSGAKGNGRPRWQLKLHDNISVWYVKPGLIKFTDSIYVYNEQKTMDM